MSVINSVKNLYEFSKSVEDKNFKDFTKNILCFCEEQKEKANINDIEVFDDLIKKQFSINEDKKYKDILANLILNLKENGFIYYIATNPKYSLKIIEFNHDIDHLHILFEAEPKSELVKFINAYKTASSRLIKQEFQHIKKYLWREYFWSRSYFLATTGGVSLEVLKKYVENQGVKEKGENLDKRTKAYRNL